MLSTHVLDTSRGGPAAGVNVTLFRAGSEHTEIARGRTDADGRIASPFGGKLASGWYELVFAVGAYFAATGSASFYDEIPVRFRVDAGEERYHVPLLISPWGYSTYRGS
ncbi:MAG TPA: hydroxyisourate hydrolase [Candidatus Acidoferrales bacterium]|nr:hydroxyisourate hydrolase [Candidatus Acidoferrales bacterium]